MYIWKERDRPLACSGMMKAYKTIINKFTVFYLSITCPYRVFHNCFQSIALQSEMMKKTSVDSWDVNTAFTLADTGPVVGATATHYTQFGEDKLCCPVVSYHLFV